MEIPEKLLKETLLNYLKEDIGYGDITSNLLIPENLKIQAIIISDQSGIVAGIHEVEKICELMNLICLSHVNDGSYISKNTHILQIEGNARSILSSERTILNILMRMSGIATLTNELVKKVKKINNKVKIACTRKTTPGFRYFEKRAVIIGGGDPHRFRLDDMVLIKDNHLFCIKNLEDSINLLKEQLSFSKKIELEVKTMEEALKGAQMGIDILMLDNFSPEQANDVINELKKNNLRNNLILEISGNITPENIVNYAKLDVDIISMGFITHSVKSFGMSLDIVKIL
ncbi:MAG: carboxylating nicotinate-nucleotide diphosphorylase [Candidatus Helarchaeota archaeon]